MNEPNTYHYETAFEFRLEANTIPTLEAADALNIEVEKAIRDIMTDKVSDVDVIVTAKTYDDKIDGIVGYKVSCGFTCNDQNQKDIAFYVGCNVADSFKRLGHTVKDFEIVKANAKPIKAISGKKFDMERGM